MLEDVSSKLKTGHRELRDVDENNKGRTLGGITGQKLAQNSMPTVVIKFQRPRIQARTEYTDCQQYDPNRGCLGIAHWDYALGSWL